MEAVAARARAASRTLRTFGADRRTAMLKACEGVLRSEAARAEILAANAEDLKAAATNNLEPALLNRLKLSASKFDTLAAGAAQLAAKPDPLGKILQRREITGSKKGLFLVQESCPLGVLLIIFESRPDALAQILTLAIRSGNALLLKGGKEARHSNASLHGLLSQAITAAGAPPDAVQLVESREDVSTLLQQTSNIDLVIPRGSNSLVQSIQRSSAIPVLGHADGICHVYVDELCDMEAAVQVVVDSKCDYPAACNAMETLLLHTSLVQDGRGQKLVDALVAAGVKVYGHNGVLGLPASPHPPHHEYSSLECLVAEVSGVPDAAKWIGTHGSNHTEAIVTKDRSAADHFLALCDSACVFVNASTRFADGFRFGLGAEVGISTSRLHARGPVGVEGLLSSRWVLWSGEYHTVGEQGKGKWEYTHKDLM